MIVGTKNERGVGYVVYAHTEDGELLLRNFGQNQDAAIEFRQWVIGHASLEEVRRYAASYSPAAIYKATIVRSGKTPILLREHAEKGGDNGEN